MSEEERKFLEVKNLKKSFGSGDTKQDVLRGIDFTVAKGEFCVLLGPSGSGKSTLLNILGGIDSADEGDIYINGDRLSRMDEKGLTQYRRKHLGYVFQSYNLIPNLNIKENIETGAYLSDTWTLRASPQAAEPALRRSAAESFDRQSDSKESGYTALRRAYRRARLHDIERDTPPYRRCQRKVRQHCHHGNAQRSHKAHGRSCHKASRRKDKAR